MSYRKERELKFELFALFSIERIVCLRQNYAIKTLTLRFYG